MHHQSMSFTLSVRYLWWLQKDTIDAWKGRVVGVQIALLEYNMHSSVVSEFREEQFERISRLCTMHRVES